MPTETIPIAPLPGGRVFKPLTREDLQTLSDEHDSYQQTLLVADRIDEGATEDSLGVLLGHGIHAIGFETVVSGDVAGSPFPGVTGGIGVIVLWLTTAAAPERNPRYYAFAMHSDSGPKEVGLTPEVKQTDGSIFVAHYSDVEQDVSVENLLSALSSVSVGDGTGRLVDGSVTGFLLADPVGPRLISDLSDVWYYFGGKLTLVRRSEGTTIQYRNVQYEHFEWLVSFLRLRIPTDGTNISPPAHEFFEAGARRIPLWRGSFDTPIEGQIFVESPSGTASPTMPGTTPSDQVSMELSDAPAAPTAEERVAAWLQLYQPEIVKAESTWSIDRRAIAGAIAWEALRNVRKLSPMLFYGAARFRGPGKVHFKEGYLTEGTPFAKAVENAGYLPKRTESERANVLETTNGSLEYIGAIMKATADVAAKSGYYINCEPAILTTFFHGFDMKKVKERFTTKKAPAPLAPSPYPDMGGWVDRHLSYIESAVGKPPASLCSKPRGYP